MTVNFKELFDIRLEMRGNMLQDISAIIFDLDGSLVDSMWIWKEIDIEYLGRFGHTLPDDLQSKLEGMSFTETAEYVKERFEIPDTIEKMKADWNTMAWDKYATEVPLKSGANYLLSYCKEHGISLGIATSNSRELVENVAKVHGLREYFDCIMTSCDVKKGKPAPDIYLAVAKELGVEPINCLVFEDIIAGIQAGRAAGMRVCGVDDEHSINQREEKIELADYYIYDYKEVFKNFGIEDYVGK